MTQVVVAAEGPVRLRRALRFEACTSASALLRAARLLALAAAVGLVGPASAAWELGALGAADSNVARSVGGKVPDSYLYGYLRYSRAPGDRSLDWVLDATLAGAWYKKFTESDYVSLALAPGVHVRIRPAWTLSLSPFVQGKAARSGAVSSVAAGGTVALLQRFGALYFGEEYTYTASRARDDLFSFREHAAGGYVGYSWSAKIATQIGYRFTRGQSFRSSLVTLTGDAAPADAAPPPDGRRAERRGDEQAAGDQLTTLVSRVARESVDSHDVTATLSYAWPGDVTTYGGYTYGLSDTALGNFVSHVGFVGISRRF